MEDVCRLKARQLLEELKVSELPVDIEKIAKHCGLEIEHVSKGKGFYGQLLKERRIIEVQSSMHPHRNRFTIAHEIGHYILNHSPALCPFDDRSIKDPKKINEKHANVFASELLMPEPWIKTYWRELKNDHRAMARKFYVSDEAMFRRLQDLKLLGLESPL